MQRTKPTAHKKYGITQLKWSRDDHVKVKSACFEYCKAITHLLTGMVKNKKKKKLILGSVSGEVLGPRALTLTPCGLGTSYIFGENKSK